ncbi:Protein FAR1-RELATED SEQUENCE 5 [Platanthera zijinensis]|uniref:Protein FAR1-RELATED SEQUENCE 5 n=1 Tax=Platanthera zijinensis TaxID=2320716 RepID=A0AAP0BFE8_9ASPA
MILSHIKVNSNISVLLQGRYNKSLFPVVQTENEAHKLYCDYARNIGFSVRKEHRILWSGTNLIKSREYCCSKAGIKRTPKVPESELKYRKMDGRTNCPAKIVFNADKEGQNLVVGKFIEEHNHELATKKDQHMLRSYRVITEEKGVVMKSMTEAGIRTSDAYNYLVDEVGGIENVGFSKSDAYNFIAKERSTRVDGGDAASLLQQLKSRAMDDGMFSYEIQTDEFNRLINFIWMDGPSKIDYECFGDVITFDSTYRMNRYNLACASFVVVNNHWQNTVVAIAFISQETIESFVWVFETFLKFVSGKQPLTIFTDQDQAMMVAIERVFTESSHRLCQWHIAKKAPTKVPTFNVDASVRSMFHACLSKCDSSTEFELAWSQMIQHGNLSENRWLSDLYKIKEKWSTAFNKTIQDHGMLSTQRSESTNNVCHAITKATCTLVDCFSKLEKMIINGREKALQEDFKCRQANIPVNAKNCPILKQVSKIYTRVMYGKFYEEFKVGAFGLFIVEEVVVSDKIHIFTIRWSDCGDNNKHWYVELDISSYDVRCSCSKFETTGILCAHVLKVYSHKNIIFIPQQYILRRWTMTAKTDYYLQHDNNIFGEASVAFAFRNNITRFAYDVAIRVEKCEEARKYVMNGLKDISLFADAILEKNCTNCPVDKVKPTLKDPPRLKPKRISNARLKDHWEQPSKLLNQLLLGF